MILVKTALGQQVLRDRSVTLSGPQRAAFILVDGRRSVQAIVEQTAGVGVTLDDIRHLVMTGLATEAVEIAPTEPMPLPRPA